MPILRYVPHQQGRISGAAPQLFARYDLHASLLTQRQLVDAEIDQWDPNALVETDARQIAEYLEAKHLVEVPALREDDITVEDRPARIDVRDDPYRTMSRRDRPRFVEGVELCLHVPVDGDPLLFETSPRVIYMNGSRAPGSVAGSELVLS